MTQISRATKWFMQVVYWSQTHNKLVFALSFFPSLLEMRERERKREVGRIGFFNEKCSTLGCWSPHWNG